MDSEGFDSSIKDRIISLLEFKGQQVNIWDEGLANVLHQGTFIGVN